MSCVSQSLIMTLLGKHVLVSRGVGAGVASLSGVGHVECLRSGLPLASALSAFGHGALLIFFCLISDRVLLSCCIPCQERGKTACSVLRYTNSGPLVAVRTFVGVP